MDDTFEPLSDLPEPAAEPEAAEPSDPEATFWHAEAD